MLPPGAFVVTADSPDNCSDAAAFTRKHTHAEKAEMLNYNGCFQAGGWTLHVRHTFAYLCTQHEKVSSQEYSSKAAFLAPNISLQLNWGEEVGMRTKPTQALCFSLNTQLWRWWYFVLFQFTYWWALLFGYFYIQNIRDRPLFIHLKEYLTFHWDQLVLACGLHQHHHRKAHTNKMSIRLNISTCLIYAFS